MRYTESEQLTRDKHEEPIFRCQDCGTRLEVDDVTFQWELEVCPDCHERRREEDEK